MEMSHEGSARFDEAVVEARHLHILDLLPGLVAYFGPDLRYRFVNRTYATWRGMEPETIIGRYVRDVVGERNYSVIAEKLREALAGQTVTYEYNIFEHQHQRRVQGTYVPDLDAARRVIGVVALVTDISRRDDLQLRIVESEAMFNDAFENAPIGQAIVGVDGCILRVNETFAGMLDRSATEMRGLNFRDITHPEDIEADLEQFDQVLDNKRNGYCLEKRYLRRDGSCLDARLAVSAIRDDQGRAVRFFAHVEDVTQQRDAERRIIATNARLSLITEAVRGGSWHIDVATGRFQPSEALKRLVNGPYPAPLGLAEYQSRIHPDDLAAADLQPLSDGEQDRMSVEYRLETVTGTVWMRCDRQLLRDANGHPEQIVGVTIDMTDEHHRHARAEMQAATDPLTGLLNRRGLDRLMRELASDCPCGVMLIDLDGFKQVNDQLGHDTGDAVLAEAADRLTRAVRSSDLVARLGGDEFVVILVGADTESLAGMAARAVSTLGEPFDSCGGATLRLSASIGASWAPCPPSARPSVLSRADSALYDAKAAGRGTWRLAE